VLEPKPGITYKITFTDETGRHLRYMVITPVEKKESTEKGSEATAAPATPSKVAPQDPAPSEAEAPITSTEAAPSTDDSPKLEEATEGIPEKEAPEAPTGPYWKHEWHVDRFGREALFIWEVGGKRWHNNADRGYAYIKTMTAKVPGDDGYDPRFEQFKRRPNIKEGVNQELNWWFKKTPGWDDPNKKDDGSADFQDLAEFKDAEHNKKGTGFYYVAYVYSPDVYEKVAAQKQLRENQKYIGETTIYQAYVAAEKGIILHQTPFPDDPAYKEKQQSEDKASYILNKNAPLTVIAEGNESSEGWVLVRDATGATGWIERRFISKTRTIEKKHAFPTYTVQPGDTLQGVIQQYYATYPFTTGNDERTVALAIYLFNKNVSGAGIYRNHKKYSNFVNSFEGSVKGFADPWMKETRANFQSVELYAGGDILLPPKWYIEDMRQRGLVEKRPDFVNSVIEGGRVIQGFVDGVGEGFVDALVGAAEDLYNLVVDIFTGAIFSQLADMFKTIFDLGFEGIWDAIKEFGIATWEEVKAAWNNPNPYVRGKYFGEIIGAILFEVVIALITWGIGTAVTTTARAARFMTKLPGWLKKFKLIPIPDDAAKHIDDLKKLGNGKKPDLDVPDKKKLDGDLSSKPKKIESPQSAKKFEKEIDSVKQKELETQAKSELDADPNWKDKKDTDDYAKKLAALTTAKIITEGADIVGLPITGLKAELSFLKALPEVRDFEFDGAADVYKVYMIGSKFLVDGRYTESGDGKYRILGKSKNGNVLQQGDSQFGWQHIVEGHVDGKPGKSMFPKGMSNSKIKELILEASDGPITRPQGDRNFIRKKFNPSKYGISEIELWINTKKGNIIETAYPKSGTAVWIHP